MWLSLEIGDRVGVLQETGELLMTEPQYQAINSKQQKTDQTH